MPARRFSHLLGVGGDRGRSRAPPAAAIGDDAHPIIIAVILSARDERGAGRPSMRRSGLIHHPNVLITARCHCKARQLDMVVDDRTAGSDCVDPVPSSVPTHSLLSRVDSIVCRTTSNASLPANYERFFAHNRIKSTGLWTSSRVSSMNAKCQSDQAPTGPPSSANRNSNRKKFFLI